MNDTILVVGAAGGVGLTLVKQLLDKGHRVMGTVLNEAEANLVKAEAPTISSLVIVDLSNADSIKSTLDTALQGTDTNLTGVAVCAAISPMGPLETTPLSMLRTTLEINTVADVAFYQACMPYLRVSKGRIVFIVSNAGRSAFPFIGHYVASKFALEGLGDVMRREAAKFGVTVSLVEPGGIKTAMPKQQAADIAKRIDVLSEEERNLYGDLYRGFQGLLKGAEFGLEASEVAEVIVTALEEPKPKTRYPIGQDAIDTIAMSRNASDEEIDAFYQQVFESGLAAADGEVGRNLLEASSD